MIRANSRVTIFNRRIKELTQAQITALEQTAEALHTEVVQAQVIPFDAGNLQGESFFVDDSEIRGGIATLVNSTPYARRLYYHPEYNFSTAENPNARGAWFEDWLKDGSKADFCQRAFKELYKRIGGV